MNVFCEFEDLIIRAEFRHEMVINEKTSKYEQGELLWFVTLVDTFDMKRHELKLNNVQFTVLMTLAHGAGSIWSAQFRPSWKKMYDICQEFLKDCPIRPIP